MNDNCAPFDPRNPFAVPTIFVIGPYSIPDPATNVNHALREADHLTATGKLVAVTGLFTHISNLISPRGYEHWYAYTLHLLVRYDAVYRISGDSHGADNEEKVCGELGIPLFHDEGKLLAWADDYTPERGINSLLSRHSRMALA